MSDPVSYQILDALRLRLEAISPGAGYNTNAGANVFLGSRQVNPHDLDEGAALQIYDTEDEPDEESAFGDEPIRLRQTIVVSAFIRDVNDESLRLMHLVIQDIFNAVLDVTDRTIGGLALDLGYAGKTVEYPEPGGDVLSVALEFSCLFEQPFGSI